jgi:hypothetical protein
MGKPIPGEVVAWAPLAARFSRKRIRAAAVEAEMNVTTVDKMAERGHLSMWSGDKIATKLGVNPCSIWADFPIPEDDEAKALRLKEESNKRAKASRMKPRKGFKL